MATWNVFCKNSTFGGFYCHAIRIGREHVNSHGPNILLLIDGRGLQNRCRDRLGSPESDVQHSRAVDDNEDGDLVVPFPGALLVDADVEIGRRLASLEAPNHFRAAGDGDTHGHPRRISFGTAFPVLEFHPSHFRNRCTGPLSPATKRPPACCPNDINVHIIQPTTSSAADLLLRRQPGGHVAEKSPTATSYAYRGCSPLETAAFCDVSDIRTPRRHTVTPASLTCARQIPQEQPLRKKLSYASAVSLQVTQ